MLYFLYCRHDVDALLLGDEEAHSLGIPVGSLKRRLLIVVSLIAAFSTAFTGMIGFVGLIVPHAVRLCIGSKHGRLLPLAAYAGGLFLLFADTLARSLISPVEIPIGVITAFFGAPFFLFLAVSGGKGRIHGS
jgi:iron complex transport system permease protein